MRPVPIPASAVSEFAERRIMSSPPSLAVEHPLYQEVDTVLEWGEMDEEIVPQVGVLMKLEEGELEALSANGGKFWLWTVGVPMRPFFMSVADLEELM